MKPLFAVLSAVAAVSLLGAPAHAQTFRELMEDIGIQKRDRPDIDFNERAPLVLPPDTTALPPPENRGDLASVNPNWPTDPEAIAEKEAEENAKKAERDRKKYIDRGRASDMIYDIRRRELEQGTAYGEGTLDSGKGELNKDVRMTPDELKAVQKARAEGAPVAQQQVYVEPERKRLTDPPPGYRAPSPAQPVEPVGEKKKKSGLFSRLNPFN